MTNKRILYIAGDAEGYQRAIELAPLCDFLVLIGEFDTTEQLPKNMTVKTFKNKRYIARALANVETGDAIKEHDLNCVIIERAYDWAVYLFPIFWVANTQVLLLRGKKDGSQYFQWASYCVDRVIDDGQPVHADALAGYVDTLLSTAL